MKRKAYKHKTADSGLLFLTGNTYKRVPVFRGASPAKIFFQELDFYREKYSFKLYGYALMPDHFHLLLNFPESASFSDFLRDFKSSVGALIVRWVKDGNHRTLMRRLQLNADNRRNKDARYRAFQPGNYVRPVISAAMLKQKLDYIHSNPVREGLVERPIEYPYSSLRNYERGSGVIAIDPHNSLLP